MTRTTILGPLLAACAVATACGDSSSPGPGAAGTGGSAGGAALDSGSAGASGIDGRAGAAGADSGPAGLGGSGGWSGAAGGADAGAAGSSGSDAGNDATGAPDASDAGSEDGATDATGGDAGANDAACPLDCGGTCVDPLSDRHNCGGCGNACAIACSAGQCTRVVEVRAGAGHAVARLSDGSVWRWGSDTAGAYPPVRLEGVDDAVSIAAYTSDLAVRKDGTIVQWPAGRSPGPAQPVAGAAPALDVAASPTHACARYVNGFVACWGDNAKCELGNGTFQPTSYPTTVTGLTSPARLSLGGHASCAIASNGDGSCWGSVPGSSYSQLFCGPHGMGQPVVDVIVQAAQGGFVCELLGSGQVQCWGDNSYGRTGWGALSGYDGSPGTVNGVSGAVQLSTSDYYGCAVQTDGTLRCWGQAPTLISDGFSAVKMFAWTAVQSASTGPDFACVLLADGSVQCFGNNAAGQLGNGTTQPTSQPVVPLWP